MEICHMPSPLLETLESRTLLAATGSGERDNLVNLLGYDQAGSSWKYRTTYDAGGSNSGVASAKVSVATTKQTFDGRDANPVKFSSSGMTLSTAWYTTSKGSFLTFTSLEAPGF